VPSLRKAKPLPTGGTVAFVAPGAAVDRERLDAGAGHWRDAGYEVVYRDDILARHRYLAGSDRRRADELMAFVRDPAVDAMVCVRGGYGAQRILPLLDPAAFREARKPLVGYSDVTALLLWLRRRAGLMGFHGPMLETGVPLGVREALDFEALQSALTGSQGLPVMWRGDAGRGGKARGRLIGGSLTTLLASLGTPWELQTRGALLLLEDVGERPYRIDRMLSQLTLAGKLDGVAGVGLGSFLRCDEADGRVRVEEVLEEWLATLKVPWVRGLPFGHAAPNLTWPLGARAELIGGRAELRILERGVSSR